jgi:hypothetical protein
MDSGRHRMKKEAFRKIHRNSEDYMFCDLQLKGRYNIYFESIISHFQCYIVKTKNEKTTYEKEREIFWAKPLSQRILYDATPSFPIKNGKCIGNKT